MSAFLIDESKVLRVGYPRWDGLSRSLTSCAPLRIAYLPTHRSEGDDANVIKQMLFGFERALGEYSQNLEFIFRPHFYDAKHFSDFEFQHLTLDHSDCVNDLLNEIDLLITDYSSVAFDFAATGRPVMFLAPDLNNYIQNHRDLYFSYAEFAIRYYSTPQELLGDVVALSHNELNCLKFALRSEGNVSDNLLTRIHG
jgi:CDP-glycerol glycerophosphotransferase